jgi:intracellular sulfur oxidation DsrE/DsrF family protein
MSNVLRAGMNRRRLLRLAGTAAAGAAAWGRFLRPAAAHDLRPNDPLYHFAEYEAIVNRDVAIRQVFEWPNINNTLVFANVRNSLNGFQFSYDVPPGQIQVVVQAYASAIAAMYDDSIWQKYRFGEFAGVTDPTTKQPAVRNIWYPSTNAALASVPTDRASAYYSDTSIEGLQRRGVLFLACHQTIHAHAGSLAADSSRNLDNVSADQIATEIAAHLVPGALMIPAGVGELVRLQDKGFRLVVNH